MKYCLMLRILVLSLLCLASPLTLAQTIQTYPAQLDTGSGVLHGSLMLPHSTQPVPLALIIPGSGPTDRNGNNPQGGHNDAYKRLAQGLARSGIASLRYDKRGVAASLAAEPHEENLSVERYVEDAVNWSRMLKQDPRFGPLILIGHSEGALIASLAAEPAGAAGLVSLSGSARPIDAVLWDQLQSRLPPKPLAQSRVLIDRLRLGEITSDVPPGLQVLFRPSVQPYLISLFRFDPGAAFAATRVPALIIQGTRDIQVSVGDARLLQAARPDAKRVMIEGMNHVLRIVPNDMQRQLASYNDPGLPLAAGLGQAIQAFVAEQGWLSDSSPAKVGR
jgi:fermentation-respiration switch protein FrsA (DUF1100 family)